MNLEKKSAAKSKTHTRYMSSKGRVPGTTTITGVMNKPALVSWANKLGLEGIEVGKYVDDLADIGTLAHYMVESHIMTAIAKKEIKPDLSDYSANQIDSANISYAKYLQWESRNDIEYIATEMILISETHQYGGQIDIYARVNGKLTLIDIKTCKAIYNDHYTQVGGYKLLLEENGHPVEDTRIIRIGRCAGEGLEAEDMKVPRIELHRQRFMLCLCMYILNKQINRK